MNYDAAALGHDRVAPTGVIIGFGSLVPALFLALLIASRFDQAEEGGGISAGQLDLAKALRAGHVLPIWIPQAGRLLQLDITATIS